MKSSEKQGSSTCILGRRVVPIALIFIGVWLLAGCIYLPIPEHSVNAGQKDFRRLTTPITPGVTHLQIIAMLGETSYVSPNGRTVVYFVDRESGLFIWPLCFSANAGERTIHALVLTFDENNVLIAMRQRSQKWPTYVLYMGIFDFDFIHENFISWSVPEFPSKGKSDSTQPSATTQPAVLLPRGGPRCGPSPLAYSAA